MVKPKSKYLKTFAEYNPFRLRASSSRKHNENKGKTTVTLLKRRLFFSHPIPTVRSTTVGRPCFPEPQLSTVFHDISYLCLRRFRAPLWFGVKFHVGYRSDPFMVPVWLLSIARDRRANC